MKHRLLAGLGIAELGALAVLWRSTRAAPLVPSEEDLETIPKHSRGQANTEHAARAV